MDPLRERREAVVREHMESENRHEFDVTLGTFHHPRYEIIATGEVHDGPDEVMRYFDTATIQRQLGIAHDPMTLKGRLATALNHPVTIAGAFLRRARQN